MLSSKYDNILFKFWEKFVNFICLKIFLNNFIWTQGRISDKYAKKRQKTKTMLNVWKKIINWKFFAKTRLSSKSHSETLSPFLITPLTVFRQNTILPTKLWNPPPPPRSCPRSEKKTIKMNIFPGINFFQEKFIWADKDTILTICFQSSKNICRKSRKNLEDSESNRKRPFTQKNPPDL